MTKDTRTVQVLVQEQVRVTTELSALTSEYQRVLQQLAAATITQQMIEDDDSTGTAAELAAAQDDVITTRAASETFEAKIAALEQELDAVIREISDRH